MPYILYSIWTKGYFFHCHIAYFCQLCYSGEGEQHKNTTIMENFQIEAVFTLLE